ncbi:hypothetical protein PR003_g25583 [Phytophthora rubi]|uniref:Uncharacterized protein n=1 Tax=Phytophthora rubi TaxID=129364 RepID=A0A6A4CF65_9STRA|nr:hypothetical protein PR003_g25583 [Phytophthora rubi]
MKPEIEAVLELVSSGAICDTVAPFLSKLIRPVVAERETRPSKQLLSTMASTAPAKKYRFPRQDFQSLATKPLHFDMVIDVTESKVKVTLQTTRRHDGAQSLQFPRWGHEKN